MPKYVVDLDRNTEYTDTNGVVWWGSNYRASGTVLDLYKPLEGMYVNGITITEVFRNGSIIQAYVETDMVEMEGLYLSPRISCNVEFDNVISVEYEATALDSVCIIPLYSVEGLRGFRLVEEKV